MPDRKIDMLQSVSLLGFLLLIWIFCLLILREEIHALHLNNFRHLPDYHIEEDDSNHDHPYIEARDGCLVHVANLTEPQPVYILDDKLLSPTEDTGTLQFSYNQKIKLACDGNHLTHPNAIQSPASAYMTCESGSLFTGAGWLSSKVNFWEVKCSQSIQTKEVHSGSCYKGQGWNIMIGVQGSGKRYDLITSCFNQKIARALFVIYEQGPENERYQPSVKSPSFRPGQWFTGIKVDNLYKLASQEIEIAKAVGSSMVGKYINADFSFDRGHLAAKTDFIFSTGQRATYTFINCVPQWNTFNQANWNVLEQSLRRRISVAGYRTKIYTGAWGTLTLKDASNNSKPIYLEYYQKKIPAPLWMYKVVYDENSKRGTAFLGLNNPHISLGEAKALAFCADVCNGNSKFQWLKWKATNIVQGFSICCRVDDFRKTVDHLPYFEVVDLLY